MTTSVKSVWESDWFSVEEVPTKPEWGLGDDPYYRIKSPDSVIILPITPNNEFVFIRQFRPTVERHTLELPAGMVDEHENPETAAERELLEETGMKTDELIFLGSGGLMVSRFYNTHSWFVALEVVVDEGAIIDPRLETVVLAPERIREMHVGQRTDHLMALGMISYAKMLLGDRVPNVW